MDENDQSQLPVTPETTTSKSAPKRRTRPFAHELLARLPQLPPPDWKATDTLNVYQDMQGYVRLDADAFLGPFEVIAERFGRE